MSSRSDVLDSIEENEGEHALLPDNIEQEAYKLLESNENINQDIVSYALDIASEYWRKHIEEEGEIITNQQGFRINFNDEFDSSYEKDLAMDIYREWEDQLELDDISELAQTLTTLPEDSRFENVPHNYDPRWSPENEDFPSMYR